MEGQSVLLNFLLKIRLHNYLNTLKRELSPIYSENEIDFIIKSVNDSIVEFLSDNPSASMESAIQFVSHKEDLIRSGVENMDMDYIKQKLKTAHKTKKKAHIVMVIILVLLISFLVYTIRGIIVIEQNTPNEEIIVIEEEPASSLSSD